MDMEEKMRLMALYASYPDGTILDMLSQDLGSYREGVYELLKWELKRRRINPEEHPNLTLSDEEAAEEIVFVVVYAGLADQVAELRGALEFEGISTFVRDETNWVIGGSGRTGVMKLAVEKRDVEKARRVLEEVSQ